VAWGGVFLLDHDDLSVKWQWEADRGPQELAYDFGWHLFRFVKPRAHFRWVRVRVTRGELA
jgi:hypothetical protein